MNSPRGECLQKGTESTVRAPNEPTVHEERKNQEGPGMNLLRGTTLSTVALRAPVMLPRAAADRAPWLR